MLISVPFGWLFYKEVFTCSSFPMLIWLFAHACSCQLMPAHLLFHFLSCKKSFQRNHFLLSYSSHLVIISKPRPPSHSVHETFSAPKNFTPNFTPIGGEEYPQSLRPKVSSTGSLISQKMEKIDDDVFWEKWKKQIFTTLKGIEINVFSTSL